MRLLFIIGAVLMVFPTVMNIMNNNLKGSERLFDVLIDFFLLFLLIYSAFLV